LRDGIVLLLLACVPVLLVLLLWWEDEDEEFVDNALRCCGGIRVCLANRHKCAAESTGLLLALELVLGGEEDILLRWLDEKNCQFKNVMKWCETTKVLYV